jgi:outer membrane protein assembly factor BamB
LRSGRAALVALDARSGARLWEVALPGDAAATGAAATPDLAAQGGAVVAVAADSGTVAAFSTATGALLAAARLPDAAYGGPVAISPTLIACGCRDDAVWGLELCLE